MDVSLQIIRVEDFKNDYSEIKLNCGQLLSTLCGNKFYQSKENEEQCQELKFPNPWRQKAGGKIIRHVPTTMYSDDTSGNVSKQFNKHISFYFTLSGLPPNITNQEYNCHFLSTSNRAGVLEIANQIIKESNQMIVDGFDAYNVSISQPVYVMSMMLCFLADSPMHAEITNTPNPGTSLNPCRMCTLHSPKMIDKHSVDYLLQFLQLQPNGFPSPNKPRVWTKTIEHTYELYNTYRTKNITAVKTLRPTYGVTDSINNQFMEGQRKKVKPVVEKANELIKSDVTELFNPFLKLLGFDGCNDTPVEILHVFLLGVVKYLVRDFLQKIKKDKKKVAELVGRLQSFDTKSLNIALLKPWYLINHSQSLVGKDFKIFLQAIPFVFFPFMTPDEQDLWFALCQLSSYIFQTHISHMASYQIELKKHIQIFMSRLIKFTAQWINKPKFHMLFHLPQSIERFATAPLCSTEKFESFNGVLRNVSTHSNKQAPGRDIANSFANYQCLRFLLSGGVIYNKLTDTISVCSPEMVNFFSQNPIVQKSFGYNSENSDPMTHYPFQKRSTLNQDDEVGIPNSLKETFPDVQIHQISQLQINAHEVVKKGSFILVASSNLEYIGCVNSIWRVTGIFFVNVTKLDRSQIHPFYRMRQFVKSNQNRLVQSDMIKSTLNLQHDCYTGKCKVLSTRSTRIERLNTTIKTPEVTHKDHCYFVLNSASLHAPEHHRRLADLPITAISPGAWLEVCQTGLANWGVFSILVPPPPNRPDSDFDETPVMSPQRTPTPHFNR
ncbi:hypothetical protein PGT21_012514 [Puccinia graminis f. sp. tritici]|uniref:Uncharacterized protein n=1 Tax=Puccinia graminis f. sp. tritici TaxID=56615 RepID=A0A5B0P248_PUCGR|nr:hypothetical protein PGT21_012514 [Puccinia graminis f. sp. tritici]